MQAKRGVLDVQAGCTHPAIVLVNRTSAAAATAAGTGIHDDP